MKNKYTGSIKAIFASKNYETGDKDDKIPEGRLSKVNHTFGFRVFYCVGRENKRRGYH